MTRLQFLVTSTSTPVVSHAVIIPVMGVLFCAVTLFMCASHDSRKWRRRLSSACYGGSYYNNRDPVIQLNNEPTMRTITDIYNDDDYRPAVVVGDADTSVPSGEQGVPVWKKNILMGGKCELPDFSGVIIYDSEGNVVTPTKTPRPLLLTWK